MTCACRYFNSQENGLLGIPRGPVGAKISFSTLYVHMVYLVVLMKFNYLKGLIHHISRDKHIKSILLIELSIV